MPKNTNLNYMNLSSLYRQNPYHTRGNALLERSSFQHSGFAGPGLALVAGRQMAKGDEWEQNRQDLMERQLTQKDDKQDMELKTKVLTLAVNAAKQGNNGLAVEILNGNKDVLGMSADKYISAFQVDRGGTAFAKIETKGTKSGGSISIGFTKDGKAWKYGGGPNGEAVPMTQADWDTIGKTAQEKDTRTTTAKDFERAQTDPEFRKFLVDKGAIVDPNYKPNVGKVYQVGEDGIAKPVKDAQGNDMLTGSEKNSFKFPVAKKPVDPAAQVLADGLKKFTPGGGTPGGAPAAAPGGKPLLTPEEAAAKLKAMGFQPSASAITDDEEE